MFILMYLFFDNSLSKRADKLQEENELTNVKQLTKQIRSLKRKIRQYEEEFEDEHGYKVMDI